MMRTRPVALVVTTLVVLVGISIVRGRDTSIWIEKKSHAASAADPIPERAHVVRKFAAPTASNELSSAITVGAIVIGLFFRQKVRVEPV